MKTKKSITPQSVNFAQWYKDVCYHSGLFDYGLVKGTIVFKPYSYAIWELIQTITNQMLQERGVVNLYFPLLIPQSVFRQEKEQISGFAPEILTATAVGDKQLNEPLYIRPTSEILVAHQLKKEVRSYRDLPVKWNQWCNIIRWEKNTKPFLRSSEFLWQEGHTFHASKAEAQAFTLQILTDVYAYLFEDYLNIYVLQGFKSEAEKFAGAETTYTIESFMPDGQALQCGTSHYFADNFAHIFDIKYEDQTQQLQYGYSTSWGISTRIIGALVMSHSDDDGLVLPWKLAPVQIVIVPFGKQAVITNYIADLQTLVQDYRVKVMTFQKNIPSLLHETEITGYPLRLEIGMREVNEQAVTIFVRNKKTKMTVAKKDLKQTIVDLVKLYEKQLWTASKERTVKRIREVNSFAEYVMLLKKAPFIALAPFCNQIACEKEIQALTQTSSRCSPLGAQHANLKCFKCQQQAHFKFYFARSY